jgi:hypothetical protein
VFDRLNDLALVLGDLKAMFNISVAVERSQVRNAAALLWLMENRITRWTVRGAGQNIN